MKLQEYYDVFFAREKLIRLQFVSSIDFSTRMPAQSKGTPAGQVGTWLFFCLFGRVLSSSSIVINYECLQCFFFDLLLSFCQVNELACSGCFTNESRCLRCEEWEERRTHEYASWCLALFTHFAWDPKWGYEDKRAQDYQPRQIENASSKRSFALVCSKKSMEHPEMLFEKEKRTWTTTTLTYKRLLCDVRSWFIKLIQPTILSRMQLFLLTYMVIKSSSLTRNS